MTCPSLEFDWRDALITGGGSGLGRELALRLAKQGIDVWICGRRETRLMETCTMAGPHAGRIHPIVCNVRDPEAVNRMFEAIGENAPGMLVNNAAGAFVSLAEDISTNGWLSVVDSTMNSVFYVTNAWGRRRMAAKQGGVIVNITSATFDGGGPGAAHSGAAKAGVVSLTKTLAAEWARFGIRVNALAPGAFNTPAGAENIWTNPAILARIKEAIPMGRIAELQEIADPALFLLSRSASYMTGSVLKVDGGWTLNGWLYIKP